MGNTKSNSWSNYLSIGMVIWFAGILSCILFQKVLLNHGIAIWGEVHHFVVSSKGDIVVRDRTFQVTYWFDSDGQLCHYLNHGKKGSIAIDLADVIYFDDYYQLTELNLQGEVTNHFLPRHGTLDQKQNWKWQLGNEGSPEINIEELINVNVPPGTVQKNEALFNRQGGYGGRTFLRADGTLYRAGIWSIQQQLPNGSWKTIVTIPWYLVPFTTPSLIGLTVIFFTRGIIQDLRRRRSAVIKTTNFRLERDAVKIPHGSESVQEPTWDIHDASRNRWRFSLWQRTIPPILVSALEMKRRLGMLRGMSDCCWNDIEIMLNPGNHPQWGACLMKWKWYYMSRIDEALHSMENKVDECIALNRYASRDEVCVRMTAVLLPYDSEIMNNRLNTQKPSTGWPWLS